MTTKTRMARQSPNGPADTRKVLEEYVHGTARFMEIPIAKLDTDHTYQREFSETLVGRIAGHFDLAKFEPPTVNVRPNHHHIVVDGGHRIEAARRIGLKTLTCRIVDVPPADEAQLFIELNRQRRWVTPVQTFKAEVAAGNPAALEIQQVLSDRGLAVAPTRSPDHASCTTTLKHIYAANGTGGLARVLDVILKAWPTDEPRRLSGQILYGVAVFLKTNPNVDEERLTERLSRITTVHLLAKTSALYHAWRASDERGGSLIDATGETIKKQYLKR